VKNPFLDILFVPGYFNLFVPGYFNLFVLGYFKFFVLGYFKAMRRIVDRYYGQKFRKIACQGNLGLLTLKTL